MSPRESSASGKFAAPDMVLTRILNAPRELVFKLWTEADELAKWWGPSGFTNPICEVNAQPGGFIRIHMRAPDGTIYPMTGIYQEIVSPERLVFISSALGADGEPLFDVLHTVTFAKEGHQTRLTVEARVLKTTAAATAHLEGQEAGWSQSLVRLKSYLQDRQQAARVPSVKVLDGRKPS